MFDEVELDLGQGFDHDVYNKGYNGGENPYKEHDNPAGDLLLQYLL